VEVFEVLLGLLAVCVALALVARRLNVPLAAVLIVGAMTLVLILGSPTIELDPQLARSTLILPIKADVSVRAEAIVGLWFREAVFMERVAAQPKGPKYAMYRHHDSRKSRQSQAPKGLNCHFNSALSDVGQ
jgi:hypothetical protein